MEKNGNKTIKNQVVDNFDQIVEGQKFSDWYIQNITQAELFDYAPTRGCMVIRPYGYAIWENIVKELDGQFKLVGVKNAYFPLFIPESFLTKEKKHIEGFSPELAVVTHAGGEKLEEPLVVRPTSETIIYHMLSKWIKSHRDLPIKLNQWANVVRWEMRTRPFLRTSEFLWQEGHTAHKTQEEAEATAHQHHKLYIDFLRDFLAIPVLAGAKTESEKFAGARFTLTMEAMMKDGRALQLGTSHLLEHSFPAAFDVAFQDEQGQMQNPWCTSWGMTTRTIGALCMVHGDAKGLIMPPKVAPVQVVIIPIYKVGQDNAAILNRAQAIASQLITHALRVEVWGDEERTPGNKFFAAEQSGIPLRIEIGPRDLLENQMVAVSRLANPATGKADKQVLSSLEPYAVVADLLQQIQAELLQRAELFLAKHTLPGAVNLQGLQQQLQEHKGFVTVNWCTSKDCEARFKEFSASSRVIRGAAEENSVCVICQKPALLNIVVARSY